MDAKPDDLFSGTEGLSPRLQWMKEFNITTRDKKLFRRDFWIAESGGYSATGDTEEDALVALAKKMGIMIWSEMLWKKGKIKA